MSAVQEGAELLRCLLLHVRQDVSVYFHRHRHLRVPEPFADDVDRLSGLQHQSGAGMPPMSSAT